MKASIVVAVALVFLVVCFTAFQNNVISAKPKDAGQKEIFSKTSAGEPEVEEYLGDGAFAFWQSNGLETMSADGYADNSVLVIHGAQDDDVVVEVSLTASIGTLQASVIGVSTEVSADSDYYLPISFKDVLNLHPMQMEYTTKILGYVRAYHQKTGERHTQLVEGRYVAYNATYKNFEIMDFETREQRYPYGFTTAKGQETVRKILEEAPEGEFIEAIGPGI